MSEIGFHGGRVKVPRPRVRDRAGKEVRFPSREVLRDGDLLLEWALNLMVLNVSTRKYHRAVRLPEGNVPKMRGGGTTTRSGPIVHRATGLRRRKPFCHTGPFRPSLLMGHDRNGPQIRWQTD